MKIVLLCGGAGKRLWPLSNEIRSKLYIPLLPAPDGRLESMLQRVCRQLAETGLLADTLLVTQEKQVELVRRQTPEGLPIFAEPTRRGTFMAIAGAVAALRSRLDVQATEPVIVVPVDPYVETSFFDLLKKMPEMLQAARVKLALVGTAPSFPSDQYGYIVPERTVSEGESFAKVAAFVEKPEKPRARALMEIGALWNCGVFAFPMAFMLDHMVGRGLPLDDTELAGRYEEGPELSFDKEIAEQTQSSIVVRYDGAWEDIGGWDTLSGYMPAVVGHGTVSPDCVNTHLINELALPVHVIGLNDVIVAASPDGLLVASKAESRRIKTVVQRFTAKPK